MSGNGNAIDYFVDRHEREGRGATTAFRDPWRTLSYGALAEATRRFAGALRNASVARERGQFRQSTAELPQIAAHYLR